MTEDLYLRFAVFLAAALLMPSVTFAMFAIAHKNMPFWRYASAGMFLIFLASTLSALRDFLPAFISLLISNMLICAGYYLSLKSLRNIYKFRNWKYLDEAMLFFYSLAIIIIYIFFYTYNNLIIIISLGIITFSILFALSAYCSSSQKHHLGRLLIIGFSVINATISVTRLLEALPTTGEIFLSNFWSPIFFIWTIASVFPFVFAQFINGNTQIQEENQKIFEETKLRLESEEKLACQLKLANEELKNLQKLLMHEFKRPLSAIQAALQASNLHDTTLQQAKLGRLTVLTSQATAYLEGVSQYQDIAELFVAPNWCHVAVADIAQDISTKWDIDILVVGQVGGQHLICDLLLLDIAISNLIENAMKFSGEAAGVFVRLSSVDGKLQIDIQDDGSGIIKSEWGKVWQKFYKLDSAVPSSLKGCGLGLYVVEQVAKVHHGYAYVVSDKPSVMRLELPLTLGSSSDA